jgi:hypothetical protein
MARTLYGGSPADVIAQVTADDGDLAPAAGVALTAWDSATGGTQLTDLQNSAGSAITQVTPDSVGRVLFYGPDPFAAPIYLQDSSGYRWRIDPADLAARVGPTWLNITGKPAVVAAGADAATARSLIGAGVDTVMTSAEATAGTDTNPRQITAAILKVGVQAAAGTVSNTWYMPVWDGTGTAPTRPTGLPTATVVVWRQPTAPVVDATHAKTGDEWETI